VRAGQNGRRHHDRWTNLRLSPARVDGGTEVTQIYDWSGVKDPRFEAFCPFASRQDLADTLANLARAVEGTP
jgi:hypothetical protein